MDAQPGARDRMVILNGTEEQVRNAYYTILGQLEYHGQPASGGYGSSADYQQPAAAPSHSGETHQVIAVENNMVGALIGKGGSVIKNIRQTSGAMVKISSVGESNDPTKRIVTIWGGNDAVLCAQQMIFTQLQQAAQDAAAGRPGGSQPPMQMSSSGDVVLNLSVANEVAGSLIGRGGSNIKELRRLSGAQIRIGDRTPGQAMRVITVMGTPQQLQIAQELISGQINSGGGGYITGKAAAAAAAAGAYVPDASSSTTPEVTVAPAPAVAPPTTAPIIPEAESVAAPTPAEHVDTSGDAPAPAPAPIGESSHAEPAPTKRKVDESDGLPANKRTKAVEEEDDEAVKEEEPDSQSLTTKWMESTVAKIRVELKKKGLDQTGRKAELVERLVAHLLS